MNRLLIRVLAVSILEICILCTHPIVRPAAASPPPGYMLIWWDDFDGASGAPPDPTKWGYLLLANQDPSCPSASGFGKFDEGCNVKDAALLDGQGNLVITTWTDPSRKCHGNPSSPDSSPNQTGMLATGDDINSMTGQPWPHLCPTMNKRVAIYGYIEARIMFTGAQNVWSSYWFQSPTYGGSHSPPFDPRTAGTEIDVVEHEFNLPDAPSALHWDAYCQRQQGDPVDPNPKSAGSDKHTGCGNLNTGFHTYGLEWTPDVLKFYYDAVLVWTVNNSGQMDPLSQIECPYRLLQPNSSTFSGPVSRAGEYIVLDNEVRVAGIDYGLKGDSRNAKMTVDYVRWYEDNAPPPPIMPLTVSGQHGRNTMALSWTAPGDDGTGQPVTKYDLRYSLLPITASNFNSATQFQFPMGFAPHAAGFPECQVIGGLAKGKTYYFAIKSADEVGNWSVISNVPSASTTSQPNTAMCPTVPTDGVAPGIVSNLSGSDAGNTSLAVSWTAPGDDGFAPGTASEYDLRYSTSAIDGNNFSCALRASIAAPNAAGSAECAVVRGLDPSTPYNFAIKTKDEWGNWSGISYPPTTYSTISSNHTAECPLLSRQPSPNVYAEAAPASPTLAGSLSFSKPYPNPARGAARFQIMIPGSVQGAKLRVDVFDVAGRRVRSIVDRTASQGQTQIEWNLLDNSGRRVASGLYMVRVGVGETRKTFPLLVLR